MEPAKWDQWRLVVGLGRGSGISFSREGGNGGIVMVRFVLVIDIDVVVVSQLTNEIISLGGWKR